MISTYFKALVQHSSHKDPHIWLKYSIPNDNVQISFLPTLFYIFLFTSLFYIILSFFLSSLPYMPTLLSSLPAPPHFHIFFLPSFSFFVPFLLLPAHSLNNLCPRFLFKITFPCWKLKYYLHDLPLNCNPPKTSNSLHCLSVLVTHKGRDPEESVCKCSVNSQQQKPNRMWHAGSSESNGASSSERNGKN